MRRDSGGLYRGGWKAENVAYFVHDLAEVAGDSEAYQRYNSALRICEAIDNGRPAQGIPTLKNELNIEGLNVILDTWGIGEPDLTSAVSGLLMNSSMDEVRRVIDLLVRLSVSQQKLYISKIQTVTKLQKSVLNALLDEAKSDSLSFPSTDDADSMMEAMLNVEFNRGYHLLRAADGKYWKYNDRNWEAVPDDLIKNKMISYARELVAESEGKLNVSSLLTAAMNILEGRAYREGNPLHNRAELMPAVINCLNGELWFDDAGGIELRPHRAENYLQHCLNVDYNPTATAPMFEEAVLGTFANSNNPKDMFRHFMELAGYICQPWRKLAIIVLLYGGGSNGKSSLMGIVQKVLGSKMVVFDKMEDMEDNPFKIGALDGKLLLFNDDMDEGACLPDGFLKKISEEKFMTGQHKHKDPFEFICRAVPVMASNTYPASRDVSEGMRRRMMAIPFSRQFKPGEGKADLFDIIWEREAAGVLNLFIEGFQRLKKRGKFDEPEDCRTAKRDWFMRSNTLPTFISECCDVGESFHEYVGDFYKSFGVYCREIGVRNVMKQPTMADRLAGLGYRVAILDGKKAVYGLRIRPEITLAIDLK